MKNLLKPRPSHSQAPGDWCISVDRAQPLAQRLAETWGFAYAKGTWRAWFSDAEPMLACKAMLQRAGIHGIARRRREARAHIEQDPPRPVINAPSGHSVKLPPPANPRLGTSDGTKRPIYLHNINQQRTELT